MFTSTEPAGTMNSRKIQGRTPGATVVRYAWSAARSSAGSRKGRPFTSSCARRSPGRAASGRCTSPRISVPWAATDTGRRVAAASMPHTPPIRSARSRAGGSSSSGRPSEVSVKPTPGSASASAATASLTARASPLAERRKRARAGALKKSARTSTVVPRRLGWSSTAVTRPPSTRTRVPGSPAALEEAPPSSAVSSVMRETAAIEGSASPRKPKLATRLRSSALRILLVAWRSRQTTASSRLIPTPSSVTRTSRFPPPSIAISTLRARASSAFSTSSFTSDAGRSTTSPAAI